MNRFSYDHSTHQPFSLAGAILESLDKKPGPNLERSRDFEEATGARLAPMFQGPSAGGFVLPLCEPRGALQTGRRDVTAGGAGGLLGVPKLDPIAEIRAASVTAQLGARWLTIMNPGGPVSVPVAETEAQTSWFFAEGAPAPETTLQFAARAAPPITLIAIDRISRKLLKSAANVDQFIQQRLFDAMAQRIDAGLLAGSGVAPEPTGIRSVAGVPEVPGGPNGAALTWEHVADLIGAATAEGDPPGVAVVLNSACRKRLMKTPAFTTGRSAWAELQTSNVRVATTNALPADLTKGTATTCSLVIAGSFASALVVLYGPPLVFTDPHTFSRFGDIRLILQAEVGFAILRPKSFARMLDALTA